MTFTYGGTPGTATAAERRDSVRWLTGDTDTTDQQSSDEEIAFALSQASNDIYYASSIAAKSIAAKYARLVDTSFEGMRTDYSDRQIHYTNLAQKLEKDAKRFGTSGLGVPDAGGISIAEMDSVEDDSDRPSPAFSRGQFRNPPQFDNDDEYSPR